MATKFETIDDYLASFPPASRAALDGVRSTIREAVPEAREKIRYGMPTYLLGGRPLLYVAGWKKHVGIYPVPTGDSSFEAEVAPYRGAKETVRFPLAQPIPLDLVRHIVELCLASRKQPTP
ncbi:MAG: DUF1801 domain-containing protein [Terracoccus sp.]